ncbi:alpha/beta hydrolase [Caulobacter vibrioides]|uniref:Alpha/beta hydrolase n=1 Tax=Caulobacter vibrioides TaxID=155892 RepID=A0A290MLG9_CAUVI|nr:alpha/beta hydrolase [Caulobacter vibrioides]ATC32851.1 alpha/beta hydrolase [Caulobacter vibrioides]
MTERLLHRRALLTGALGLALAPALTPTLARAAATTTTITVGDRELALSVFRPAKPKGVIVFSHGAGGSPEAYATLLETWSQAGFLVVAPLHVDSQKHPRKAQYNLRSAFPLRIADVGAAGGWAGSVAPDLPLAYAGHSYGALTSQMRGGALEAMIPARDPKAKAALCFSSPGTIQGLMGPTAFQTLNTPTLMLTGEQDVLPGLAPNWRDHLRAVEESPAGGKYAWIGKSVDHGLAHNPQHPAFAEASALSVTFLKAHLLGDAKAKAALEAKTSTDTASFWRR